MDGGVVFRYPAWNRIWLFGGYGIVMAYLGSALVKGRAVGGRGAIAAVGAIFIFTIVMLAIIAWNPVRFTVTDTEVRGRNLFGVTRSWPRAGLRCDGSRAGLWGSYRVYDAGDTLVFHFWPGLRDIAEFRRSLGC